MTGLIRNPLARSGAVASACVAFAMALSGCSSTSQTSRIQITASTPPDPQGIQVVDARSERAPVYRRDGRLEYLGDNNFQAPPVQLIAARLNEKLGDRVRGKAVSLLEFQARISSPSFQTYPGMPIAAELLGRGLGLPQLGSPHYATVSLRGAYQQKEFSGNESIPFYLGSGDSEISEAFDAALSEAAASLLPLLTHDTPPIIESGH